MAVGFIIKNKYRQVRKTKWPKANCPTPTSRGIKGFFYPRCHLGKKEGFRIMRNNLHNAVLKTTQQTGGYTPKNQFFSSSKKTAVSQPFR